MFGTIRKHQTWLWAIIITLTIISFVIFFSPYTKMNNTRGGAANFGSIDGQRISQEQYVDARREVLLRYFFMSGNWLDEQEAKRSQVDLERETYQWLFLTQKQNDMGIHISTEELARVARNMLQPLQKAGVTSPSIFVQKVLQPRGFRVEDFERFVRHELGVQELMATVGLPGKLVTPQEAQALYQREHQELATEAVFFSASNYLASVNVAPEAVAQYFSNNLANYRIPERLQVNYVKFELTNFLAEAMDIMAKTTNLDERIEVVYRQRGTNYYRDLKPELAKEKIREEMRRELSTSAARKKASEFAGELFDKEPMVPGNLEVLARQKGMTVGLTAPFDRREGPKDIEVGPDFVTKAFALSATNEPFSPPLVGEDAVYVLAYNRLLPSAAPSLEQVRDRVVNDYKFVEAVAQARAAGMIFSQGLTNALAQGKTFADFCASSKRTPLEIPPFSISTRSLPQIEDRVNLNYLKQIAFGTPVGKVSDFQRTTDGGMVLHVKSQIPLDPEKMKADLPAFTTYVRQTRQTEAFNEWFRKEAERGLRDTPLARQSAPAAGARPRKS